MAAAPVTPPPSLLENFSRHPMSRSTEMDWKGDWSFVVLVRPQHPLQPE
jgi:hypothetical protein